MRKLNFIYLSALMLLLFGFSVNAQIYQEDFESGFVNFQTAPHSTDTWVIETSIIHGGTQSAYLAYTANAYDTLLQTTAFDLTGTTNPQLSFWHIAKSEGSYDECYVKISIDGGNTFTALTASDYLGSSSAYATDGNFWEDSYPDWGTGTETPDNTWWKKETFDLSAYNTSSNVIIMFELTSDGSVQRNGWYIDDILIEDVSCLGPSALTATNITTTSADLGWTENGSATTWNIELGSAGFTPTGTPTQTGVTTNPYTYTGLTASTSYDFYVQADCGGGDLSAWVGPFTFTTACDAISTFPFVETFNSTSTTENCWTILNENGDGDYWNLNYTTNTFEGDQCAVMYTDYNSGANDDYLITPQLTLTGNERLVYQYRVQSSSEPNDFEVLLSTTTADASAFSTVLLPNASYSNTTYAEQIINLSAYTGNVYIAFHVPNGGLDGWRLYIDQVEIEPIPSCPDPSTLTATNITDISADLGWTENGTATTWNIELGPAGFTHTGTPTQTGVTTNPYTYTGLTANTSYDFYVQADCGGGDLSAWVGPFNFTTSACPPSSQCLFTLNYNDSYGDGWNGAAVALYQDGTHLGDYTLSDGFSAIDSINLCEGSVIDVIWVSGSYDGECSFTMSNDGSGLVVASFSDGSVYADGDTIQTFTVNCSSPAPPVLVITEIMYNPPESGTDSLEFFEIYNNDTVSVNLDGYTLDYNGNVHSFNTGVTMNPGDYVVVAIDSAKFESFYGLAPIQSTVTTGVGNNGATVTLYDQYAQVVDQVTYDDSAPWPTSPDGTGPSLVLCDYNADNNDGNNWYASTNLIGTNGAGNDVFASPGAADVVCSTIKDLAWDATTFVENAANDGSISSVVNLTLTNETFATTGILTGTEFTSANVPAGLNVEINVTSSTTATVTLVGNAISHTDADDVSNMEITFLDAAFTGGVASDVANYSQTNLSVDFFDAALATDLYITTPDTMNYDCDTSGVNIVPICLTNDGALTIPAGDTIFIYYEYPIGNIVADTLELTSDVLPGDTICTTFDQTVDFSAIQVYDFNMWFYYYADTVPANDTLHGQYETYAYFVDLGGVNDTLTVSSYPTVLDAGTCTAPGGMNCYYLWSTTETTQTINVNTDGWYSVYMYDDNGCDAEDSVYVFLNTSVNSMDISSFNVYPNPNKGVFRIVASTSENTENVIELLNVQSQVIEIRKVTGSFNESFDVRNIAKGIYYIKVSNDNGTHVKKVIVQ